MLASTVDLDALGRIGTALADETRRRLLVRLLDGPGYPAELAERFGLTKANVSNHLACLRGCGLVATTAEGRRVRYELADPRFAAALAQLVELALPPAEGCAHGQRHRP
jgi:DNA-binding transcriptional ArsR family regulator